MKKQLSPLKALEKLKDLEDLQGGRDEFFEYVKVIEKALRAFEIAVSNNLDFDLIQYAKNWEEYQAICNDNFMGIFIRKEDFKLLKEVLK